MDFKLAHLDFIEPEFDAHQADIELKFDSIHKTSPYAEEIKEYAQGYYGETPSRIHLEAWTKSRFQKLLINIAPFKNNSLQIRIGYSVKTSPTPQHLAKARAAGFYLECISQLEIHRALEAGALPEQIILNGPGKFWPTSRPAVTGLHMLFCDSIEEFERTVVVPNLANCLGMRMRIPNLPSRFGICVDQFESFQRILKAVKQIHGKTKLGFHFHMPSWSIGIQRWKEALQGLLVWCQSVEQLTKVPVKSLDLGGGFFPSDLEGMNLDWIHEIVKTALPYCEGLYFEPGRALSQEGEILVSRILDVRRAAKQEIVELVVDACIAELPLIHSHSHRIYFSSQRSTIGDLSKDFHYLTKGKTKILGRICMENDVLSQGLLVPDHAKMGDMIIFGDAGAYERTMSYDFGRG